MNGITWLLLLAATAQVGDVKDFGWQINKDDGVVEYIVQIKPTEVVAMQTRSLAFPSGQEDVSNMPPELIGRAARIVVRIGDDVLPRTPSLQELDRLPRRGASLDPATTAQLGPGRMQDLEANSVFNIQQNSNNLALPNLPNGLPASGFPPTASPSMPGQSENLIDQVGKAAGTLRDNGKSNPSEGLPAFPDPSALAQNLNNQQGSSSFLNDTRGSKFNSTAPPATASAPPATGPFAAGPFAAGSTAPLANSNNGPLNANNSSRNLGTNGNSGATTSSTGLPSYPDPRLNPPSLTPSQPGFPQQQTPAAGFGTSPNFANRQPNSAANGTANGWNTSPTSAGGPGYASSIPPPYADPYASQQPNYTQPSFSQPGYTSPNYTAAAITGGSPFPQTSSQQTQPLQPPAYDRTPLNSSQLNSTGRGSQSTGFDSNRSSATAAQTPANANVEYLGNPSTTVEGVLQVLFLLSLVVNFYLGILIRKLLIRYRSLLTNVRSQPA